VPKFLMNVKRKSYPQERFYFLEYKIKWE